MATAVHQIHICCCISVIALFGGQTTASSNSRPELVFGLITGDREAKAGAEEAVEYINSRSDLLPDFNLKYVPLAVDQADECNEAPVLGSILQQIFNSSHRIVTLIGSGCSTDKEATAKLSQYYNITLISCSKSLNDVSNRVTFPYYFQLLPSEVNLARVFYSIITTYNWRRVALIVQNEFRYRMTMKSLKNMFKSQNKESDTSNEHVVNEILFNTEDGLEAIDKKVFNSQDRIYVVAMDSKFARKLLCLAHRLQIHYPKHVFLMYGSYESQWWSIEDEVSDGCSAEDRAMVLQFSLAALHYGHLHQNLSINTCQTTKRECDGSYSSYFGLESYHLCYDAIVAQALALNETIEELNTNGTVNQKAKEQAGIQSDNMMFEITDWNYNVSTVANLIKMNIESTCFDGFTGPVRFDDKGVREATDLRVLQYRATYINGTPFRNDYEMSGGNNSSSPAGLHQRIRLVDVAFVSENGGRLEFRNNNTKDDIWPGLSPRDGTPDTDISTVLVPVAVILIIFDIGGLAFALICLVFNLYHRDKKLIRLSSPNLNNMIVTGVLLVYSSSIAFALPLSSPPAVSAFCFIRTWLLAFGFTCGFAPIVAKMWRVYYIFRNPQATKRKSGIHDWHLMIFVFSLLLMNVVIMLLNIILEYTVANFNAHPIPNMEMPSAIRGELNIEVNFIVFQCSSHPWIRYLILSLIYGYMIILQICALFFAFQTRKVKVKGLNDAKYIAMTVYVVGCMVILLLITTFALPKYVTVYAAVYGTSLWMSATVVLGLLFIPKMVRLYKDPRGETVFTAHEEALQVTSAIAQGCPFGDHAELSKLTKKIKQLEDNIEEYKRITGLNLMERNRLTTSVSMINICPPSYMKEKQKPRHTSKVSFEFSPSNPPQDQQYDDSNNCEVILENVPYSDSD